MKTFDELQIEDFMQKKEKILEMMASNEVYEHAFMMRERMKKAKQILTEYKKKYNKIVVVAHYYVI